MRLPGEHAAGEEQPRQLANMAFNARRKIVKEAGKVRARQACRGLQDAVPRHTVARWLTLPPASPVQAPDEFEESVAQALFDLEATNTGACGLPLAKP